MISYSFKKDAFSPAYTFTVENDCINWSSEKGSGKIEYLKIAKVRLIYSPNRYQKNTYALELYDKYGGKTIIKNTNYENFGNFKEQNEAFNIFVTELHKKIITKNTSIIFQSGTTPLLYYLYWIIMIITILVILGVFYLIITIGVIWIAIAHMLFVLYLIPTFIKYLKKNKPGNYDPHKIPADLLPSM